jgi:hypothetical protein
MLRLISLAKLTCLYSTGQSNPIQTKCAHSRIVLLFHLCTILKCYNVQVIVLVLLFWLTSLWYFIYRKSSFVVLVVPFFLGKAPRNHPTQKATIKSWFNYTHWNILKLLGVHLYTHTPTLCPPLSYLTSTASRCLLIQSTKHPFQSFWIGIFRSSAGMPSLGCYWFVHRRLWALAMQMPNVRELHATSVISQLIININFFSPVKSWHVISITNMKSDLYNH